MMRLARAVALALTGTLLTAGAAWGVPQSKAQQKCITKLNARGMKIHEAQGGNNRKCVKDFSQNKLTTPTGEDCIAADIKGKVAKQSNIAAQQEAKFCVGPGVPDFAYTSALVVSSQGEKAEIDLMHDLFGDPIDGGLFKCDPQVNECFCQRFMITSIEKLMKVIGRVFLKCKKAALKEGKSPFLVGAASAAEVQACLDDAGTAESVAADTGGQILKVFNFLTGTLNDKCEGTGVTNVAFSGPACNGLSGNAARDCIVRVVRCRMCLLINAMDGLSADCDAFDDGAANASCSP
jgi:hypothetical protein